MQFDQMKLNPHITLMLTQVLEKCHEGILPLYLFLLEVPVKDLGLETKVSGYPFLLEVAQGKIIDTQAALQTRTSHRTPWMVREFVFLSESLPTLFHLLSDIFW